MKCRQLRCLVVIAVAIAGLVTTSSAFALSVDPYKITVADAQGLGNSTDANNLSKITAMTVAPDGIHLDVDWALGQNSDPFGANFGQTFARIGLTVFTNSENGGAGRTLSPKDGILWNIESDLALQNAQPFLQTPPNWTFYEPSIAYPIAAGMVPSPALLDFTANTNNFSGLPAGVVTIEDGSGLVHANAMGVQIVGPAGLVPGQVVHGHVWIVGVPEPSTIMLSVLGAIGLVGLARRRRS
jgi:PEP-CTERM motif-containing protein